MTDEATTWGGGEENGKEFVESAREGNKQVSGTGECNREGRGTVGEIPCICNYYIGIFNCFQRFRRQLYTRSILTTLLHHFQHLLIKRIHLGCRSSNMNPHLHCRNSQIIQYISRISHPSHFQPFNARWVILLDGQ